MKERSRLPLKNLKHPAGPGIYFLIIHMDRATKVVIGKKGEMLFRKGYYIYVGSAMNGLQGRIKRHLSDEKKMHWHVDYLLRSGEVREVYVLPTTRKIECEAANYIASFLDTIVGFGSSDCRCPGHLFYSPNLKQARIPITSFSDRIIKIL